MFFIYESNEIEGCMLVWRLALHIPKILAGITLEPCVEFACSWEACVGFLHVFRLLPAVRKRKLFAEMVVVCSHECVAVNLCGPIMDW